MTQSKHTPAPWVVRHKHHKKCDYLQERETYAATKDGKKLPTEGEEGKANAHLTAAAPDMLEALESLVVLHDSDGMNPWYEKARRAINKAKGLK